MKEGCMSGSPLFASHSLPPTKQHVRNGPDNIRIRHNFTGLMFSSPYESRFSLPPDSGRLFIFRKSVTRYHPCKIIERDHYAGGGLIVWAGIMQDTRTPLHVFDNGSVNAQRYRQEVLEPYVRLFRGAVGPEFIFMDGASK